MAALATQPPRTSLIGDGDPDAPIRPPAESEFTDQGVDFIAAPVLVTAVRRLIDAYPAQYGHLAEYDVDVLWKAKGGVSRLRETLAKAVQPTGLTRHYAGPRVLMIWLAADHFRERAAPARFVEACLFHELCHFSIDDKGNLAMVDHDFVGFGMELAAYGLWQADLLRASRQFAQLALPLEALAGPPRTVEPLPAEIARQSDVTPSPIRDEVAATLVQHEVSFEADVVLPVGAGTMRGGEA